MSSVPFWNWQLPNWERDLRRRMLSFAKEQLPGTAQKMCRTVIGFDGALLWGGTVVSRPMSATWGDFL